jgi:hypothetical protein
VHAWERCVFAYNNGLSVSLLLSVSLSLSPFTVCIKLMTFKVLLCLVWSGLGGQ